MTESGRRAFVHAVCYIHEFDREAPLVRKKLLARGYLLDRAARMAKIEENYGKLVAAHKKRAAARRRAEAVQLAGKRKLTADEKLALGFPVGDPMSFDRYGRMMFEGHCRVVIDELGTSLEARRKYLGWYEQHLEFLYGNGSEFLLDEDAKAWGLSNRDPAILRKAVTLLEQGQQTDRAQRVLTRYTGQRFTTPAAWRRWLDAQGGDLFFSEVGGFRFYSSRPSPAAPRALPKRRRRDERRS